MQSRCFPFIRNCMLIICLPPHRSLQVRGECGSHFKGLSTSACPDWLLTRSHIHPATATGPDWVLYALNANNIDPIMKGVCLLLVISAALCLPSAHVSTWTTAFVHVYHYSAIAVEVNCILWPFKRNLEQSGNISCTLHGKVPIWERN